jgi:feruloyl esterase
MEHSARACARSCIAAGAADRQRLCGNDDDAPTTPALPRLGAATPAALSGTCAGLAAKLTALANTTITATTDVPAGTLTVGGQPVAEHCQVTGSMFQRVGIDGNNYAIGFEMRLPLNWNGRFFYQANGGIDGNVVTATGA